MSGTYILDADFDRVADIIALTAGRYSHKQAS